MRILCISWNTESIRFSSSTESAVDNDDSPRNWQERCRNFFETHAFFSSVPPLFVSRVEDEVKARKPELVVVALQEASKPGSYLMSHTLPGMMLRNNYILLKRTRLMGLGVTTWKALLEFDIKVRGLRLAVYARHDWLAEQCVAELQLPDCSDTGEVATENGLFNWFGDEPSADDSLLNVSENYSYCSGMYSLTLGKGALSIGLDLPGGTRLKIINMHLPFDAASILGHDGSAGRAAAVDYQDEMLNKMYHDLVEPDRDDYVIVLGDLNYRVAAAPGESAVAILREIEADPASVYQQRDELLNSIQRGSVVALQEGVDGAGPAFLPTAKLRTGTEEDEFNIGKEDRRVPSWCDRIMFRTLGNAGAQPMRCLEYDRWRRCDSMQLSDHAAVIAVFEVSDQSDPVSGPD